MSDYKRHKEYEFLDVGDKVDRISSLPNCMLGQILSFLPTKDAVKTCILSKRWKNLWTSVPNIDFDDAQLYASEANGRYPHDVTCFMRFVERVLLLRDISTMKKFRLSCRVCFNASCLHAWISAAIKHKVQELDLCLFVEEPFMLPCCMFDSISLTVMKIEMNCVLELPDYICFPCLKTLHLSLVTFPNDNSMQNLFSGCPVLQELAIADCEWINLKSLTIFSATLKSLTIDDLPDFGSIDDPSGCEIKIDAANLKYFKYVGYLSNVIFLNNISSLIKAYIHICIPCERLNEVAYRAVGLLNGVQNVSSLRISNRTIESLICADNVLHHLPLFGNLSHLKLSMEIDNHTAGAFMELLRCCPNLQSLYFSEGLARGTRLGENDSILTPIPKCLLSCLKTVSFKNFQGTDSEMFYVDYFLKHALVLERMNICCCKNALGDSKKQREVRNQLKMLACGSMACAVTFC